MKNWIWPSIFDKESARQVARQGIWAAVFVASITALFATISLTGTTIVQVDAWAYIDAVFFALIAFGIYKMSRIASILGLLLYLFERAYMWSTIGPKGLGMAAIIILAFVNSVRGTFAYHKVINSINVPKGTLGVKYWVVSITILAIVLFAGISLMRQSDKFPDSGITSNDSNINEDSDMNEMNIFSAATFGNIDEIKAILTNNPELVNAKDKGGMTPLHLAMSVFSNKEAVELLIAKGAEVNAKDNYGATPLHIALSKLGNKDIVKLLADNGANVNTTEDRIGATPLHFAVDRGLKDIVDFLISRGADINARDKIGGTALHHLAQEGREDNTDMIEFLISKGADINAKDSAAGGTPLHYASMNGYINMVRFLIDKGADVTCQGKDGVTALSLAENEGHKDIADLLRKHMKEIHDLLSSIEETGYKDKKVLVLTERLKKIAPEINKKLGDELKKDYKFEWYSMQMLALKTAEQLFRALNMINDADKVNKTVESFETAWLESDLHEILYADFYNKELETVLNNITENMSEEERQKLTVDIAPVKALAQKLREQGDPNN